jgi:hypothetical protein
MIESNRLPLAVSQLLHGSLVISSSHRDNLKCETVCLSGDYRSTVGDVLRRFLTHSDLLTLYLTLLSSCGTFYTTYGIPWQWTLTC